MLYAHSRPVTSIKFNRDGDLLFTAGHDGQVNVFYTDTGERLGTYGIVETNDESTKNFAAGFSCLILERKEK